MSKDSNLRIEDVAARYDKSYLTIRRWCKNEKLNFPQPIRLGKRMYFSSTELQAFEGKFCDRFGART